MIRECRLTSSRLNQFKWTLREKILLIVAFAVIGFAAIHKFSPPKARAGIPGYVSRESIVFAGNPHTWSRSIEVSPHTPFEPFVLLGIGSFDGKLDADVVFMNSKAFSVSVEGTDTADGEIWLSGTAQVSNDINGKWVIIGQSRRLGPGVSISVEPKGHILAKMDFEVFRPKINKYEFGKVVLKTGDAVMFELKDLLPPDAVRFTKSSPKKE